MLAARDQENLVHNHQAAAAAKPLNQGTKQLPPKTPARTQLAPKTPFKVPLNDENGGLGQGPLKTILKTNGKGNENYTLRGKKTGGQEKNAFVTPSGGLKTLTAALNSLLMSSSRSQSTSRRKDCQCQNQGLSNARPGSQRQCAQGEHSQGHRVRSKKYSAEA